MINCYINWPHTSISTYLYVSLYLPSHSFVGSDDEDGHGGSEKEEGGGEGEEEGERID